MYAGDMFNYMAQKPGPLCKMFVAQTVELAKSWKNWFLKANQMNVKIIEICQHNLKSEYFFQEVNDQNVRIPIFH